MSGLTGRFLSRDPIGYRGSDTNLSELFEGRALVGSDPNGLELMFPATCQHCKTCNGQSILNQICRFGSADPPQTICTSSTVACPIPLGKDGKPMTDPRTGKILLNPRACCANNVPSNYSPWCTEFFVNEANAGGPNPYDSECEREMAKWIGSAGQGQGSAGHLNCLAWCEKCVAANGGLGPGDPVYGHLKQICVDQICGNAFG